MGAFVRGGMATESFAAAQAAAAVSVGLGVGQTWQNKTSVRGKNITYVNTLDRAICIYARCYGAGGGADNRLKFLINGVEGGGCWYLAGYDVGNAFSVVPPGATYSLDASLSGPAVVEYWGELI